MVFRRGRYLFLAGRCGGGAYHFFGAFDRALFDFGFQLAADFAADQFRHIVDGYLVCGFFRSARTDLLYGIRRYRAAFRRFFHADGCRAADEMAAQLFAEGFLHRVLNRTFAGA